MTWTDGECVICGTLKWMPNLSTRQPHCNHPYICSDVGCWEEFNRGFRIVVVFCDGDQHDYGDETLPTRYYYSDIDGVITLQISLEALLVDLMNVPGVVFEEGLGGAHAEEENDDPAAEGEGQG